MEFGSLGLGLPSQSASNQTGVSSLAQSASANSNPESSVTPVDNGGATQNDRRQDLLGQDETAARNARGDSEGRSLDELQSSSRRTTLNFDSEQNRIFLQVVDTNTEEVIEQIPSDQLVELVQRVLGPTEERIAGDSEEANEGTELAV